MDDKTRLVLIESSEGFSIKPTVSRFDPEWLFLRKSEGWTRSHIESLIRMLERLKVELEGA